MSATNENGGSRRNIRGTRASRACVLAIAALLLGAGNASLTPDQIIKRWKDGPVRYLLTGEEEETLRGLHTIQDLARFITGFWAGRDPSPGTFENEYRRLFWQRVAEGNKRFRVATTPGWKTDRGKIFILLGEPFDIETNARGVGAERWSYRRTFSKVANPEFYVVFRYSRGEMVMDNTSASLTPYYDFNDLTDDLAPMGVGGAAIAAAQAALVLETAVQANFDLGEEATAVVSNAELAVATVNTSDFVSAFTATPKLEFFRAKDGTTFVNLCGLIRATDLYGKAVSGLTRARVYASLVPVDAGKPAQFATNEKTPSTFDLSKGPDPGGFFAVWTGVAVPPGRYTLTMAIEDSLTGRLGRASSDVEVPDFSGSSLSISTPVLASALAEAKDRMDVTARSSSVFRRSEDFNVYYEVYGVPQRSGTTSFDASYRFLRITPEGTEPIGRPIVLSSRTEASQGWSFPLAKWPAGRYEIEITVTAGEGRPASAKAPFEVIDDEGP